MTYIQQAIHKKKTFIQKGTYIWRYIWMDIYTDKKYIEKDIYTNRYIYTKTNIYAIDIQ